MLVSQIRTCQIATNGHISFEVSSSVYMAYAEFVGNLAG